VPGGPGGEDVLRELATPQAGLVGPPAGAERADRNDSLALLFGCGRLAQCCAASVVARACATGARVSCQKISALLTSRAGT
jgi:hypothetical protein